MRTGLTSYRINLLSRRRVADPQVSILRAGHAAQQGQRLVHLLWGKLALKL
jgi:hypothetical protein